MNRNRIRPKLHCETPPIVPKSALEWVIPIGKFLLGFTPADATRSR